MATKHKPDQEGRYRIWLKLALVSAASLLLPLLLLNLNRLQGNASPDSASIADVATHEQAIPPSRSISLQQADPVTIRASDTVTTCLVDVVQVLDESGSMNDDTYCWDCFLEADDADFPAGYREYLPYADWICENQAPILDYRGYEMLVAEAEYFSYSTSLDRGGPNDYQRDQYTFPNTFWMLQRTENSQASGYACLYDSRLECGAHLMLMPHMSSEDIPGNATPYTPADRPAPRLDYQFDIPIAGTWYAWIRAQCGARYNPDPGIVDSCIVHWGVDGQWNPSDYPSTSSS
ncbi:MAG: hypothetical protein JXA89_01315, partial [Anaerolineae bacterium]|nr:hypothetical protein [Anaerolineae bacterium]